MRSDNAAGLVGAGLLSVVILPMIALAVHRRGEHRHRAMTVTAGDPARDLTERVFERGHDQTRSSVTGAPSAGRRHITRRQVHL